jgi:uncharacterized membrane protein YdjX (TVP38/TMEM64 family)
MMGNATNVYDEERDFGTLRATMPLPRKYLIPISILLVIGLISLASTTLQELFLSIMGQAEKFADALPIVTIVSFVALAALSALVSPFSSAPLIPIAVSLWGATSTTLLLLCGWLIGDIAAYYIGKYGGNPLLQKFLSVGKVRQYETYFAERMTFMKALIIRLALPAEVGYGFGIIKYNFSIYLIITAIAETVFAIVTVQAAGAFVNLDMEVFSVWLLVLGGLVGGFYYLLRRQK